MAFTLPPLPYPVDALAPHLSAETLELHHGKHHQAYVTKLNELTDHGAGDDDLEAILRSEKVGTTLFNQAGQHWNHTFYWHTMTPGGGGQPTGELADALSQAFGSFDTFHKELHEAASTHFGSGWAWLVHDGSGLTITTTSDADLPLAHDQQALLTIDVWEHAYYVDYRNRRADYLSAFLDHLVDWSTVAERLRAAT